jgi:hypothetical protein
VTLVAVSKTAGVEMIREAMAAGQTDFGENRSNELAVKIEEVGPGPRWHFIGRLQHNKVRYIAGKVHLIHSVDRAALGKAISKHWDGTARILVQVSTSGEPTKGGVAPELAEGLVERLLEFGGLEVAGFMTMAPLVADPSEARPYFKRLARLAENLAGRFSEAPIHHLSMGMSQDYEVAIEEGATIVRIGEAIFGSRMQTRTEN